MRNASKSLPRRGTPRSPAVRSGLTLIELLAALTLATLLLGAIMGILSGVTQGQRRLREDPEFQTHSPWKAQLIRQLRWDLENSRRMRLNSRQLLLEGFAGTDFETRHTLHAPTVVSYELIDVGQRRHLYRRERHIDPRRPDDFILELVCVDIASLVCDAGGSSVNPQPVPSGPAARGIPDGPLPERLRITLLTSDQLLPVFQHDFQIR